MEYLLTYPFTSVIVGFGIAALIFGWFVFDLHRKWRQMFGRRPPSSGGVMSEALERVVKAEQRLDRLEPRMAGIEAIGKIAVQKVGFLRFNPFADTGSDQSFALALLDRQDNGVIISSLYTREGVRVYAKEVRDGASKYPLSEEEKRVLEQAISAKS